LFHCRFSTCAPFVRFPALTAHLEVLTLANFPIALGAPVGHIHLSTHGYLDNSMSRDSSSFYIVLLVRFELWFSCMRWNWLDLYSYYFLMVNGK
jgi:hypothetical protein